MANNVAGIDPVNWAETSETSQNFWGPVVNTGLGHGFTFGFTRRRAENTDVFKSINGGVTWTEVVPPVQSNSDTFLTSVYDSVNKIVTLAISGAGGLYLIDFNIITESFVGPYATGGTSASVACLRKLSDGSFVVLTINGSTIQWIKFSGGTWGAPVTVTNPSSSPTRLLFSGGFISAIVDSSDNTCVAFPDSSNSAKIWIQTVGPGGAIGSFGSVTGATTGGLAVQAGVAQGATVNFYLKTPSGGGSVPNQLTGSGTSFSIVSISASIGSDFGAIRLSGSGNLVCDFIGGASHFNTQIYTSTLIGGVWSVPTLQYDSFTTFPSNLTPAVTNSGEMTGISANDNGWVTNMQAHDTVAGQDNTTIVFIGNFSGTPPVLLCPTNNQATVGQFASFLLQASSGTPPYTFSITGGSLPPGLTLGTSTGIISGIPTQAGTFSYVATVTDSNGFSASVVSPCPIIVGCPQGFQRT